MNKQETFDKVAKHLLKQNARAVDMDDRCVYYDEITGRKCAVGCLIPAHLYSKDIESATVSRLVRPDYGTGERSLLGEFLNAFDIKLLSALQAAHDEGLTHSSFGYSFGYSFAYRLAIVAENYDLKFNEERLRNES